MGVDWSAMIFGLGFVPRSVTGTNFLVVQRAMAGQEHDRRP